MDQDEERQRDRVFGGNMRALLWGLTFWGGSVGLGVAMAMLMR